MEKLDVTKNTTSIKKVFLRKEMESSRLGEEIYADEILSPYSVYLVRKFEETVDYEEQEQFNLLLPQLAEAFNDEFTDFVVKNIYVRGAQNAVYISLFLALAQPLNKGQITDLRGWMSEVEVPELPLEHVSQFADQEFSFEMVRGLQETNSEVLLLTEMLNQFGENLTEIYDEVQTIKNKKSPPVVKIVKSDVAARQSIETENGQRLTQVMAQMEQFTKELSQYKKEVAEKTFGLAKPKTPPKFKITFGPGEEAGPTLEARFEAALKTIEGLTKKVDYSEKSLTAVQVELEESQKETHSRGSFEALETRFETALKTIESLTKKVEDSEKSLTAVQAELEASQKEYHSKASVETVETQLEAALKTIESLTKKVEDSEKSLIAVQVELKENKEERQTTATTTVEKSQEEQQKLEEEMAHTTNEVTALSTQLERISEKINIVEANIIETRTSPETLARLEADRGQLQETTSETVKLNQVINHLTEKLQIVEAELTTVKAKKKKIPAVRLTKSDAAIKLEEQHKKDQEQLKANATEIKKLTQTVGKVDVQLIKAHQKIAELEQKMWRTPAPKATAPAVAREEAVSIAPKAQPIQPAPIVGPKPVENSTNVSRTITPVATEVPITESVKQTRNFPSKEAFLQGTRSYQPVQQAQPASLSPVGTDELEERPTVTLAIEEMLDRVSEKHSNEIIIQETSSYAQPSDKSNDFQEPTLRQLRKLEWDIRSYFQRRTGLGQKGMISKDDFNASIRQIEVLPYLWASVYEREKKDILLGNDLSCQQLIEELDYFMEEVGNLAKKRKVMGKWIYCPKEIEQKMEGYKLLSNYLESYLNYQNSK